MNFYKHFIGDYARDTAHLSMLEHAAYRLLLDHYYATEQPLPMPEQCERICRASTNEERAAVQAVLSKFFKGGVNNRASLEINKMREYKEAQAMRAHMRWQYLGNASHSHSHSQTKELTTSLAQGARPAPIEVIPIKGGEFPVEASFVAELDRAYPAVDVPQTLKEIRAWMVANPDRQKTRRGIGKCINSWCAREQEKHGRQAQVR